jgi:tRNA dimethylallyltransferase
LYTDTIYKNYSLPDAKPDFAFREKLYKLEEEKPGILWEKLNKVDPKEASKLHPHSVRYIIRALEIYEKT